MHLATLKTYLHVRDVVVSFLQAKRVWTPNATYAGSAARKDPNAMDIGKIGDKGGKGKRGDKRKNDKGKGGKDNHGKGKGKSCKDDGGKKNEKDWCAICWKTSHATDKCWYNSEAQEKGGGKSQGQVSNVNEGEADSVLSAGPSASQVGSSVIAMPSSVNTTPSPKKSVRKIGEHRLSGKHRQTQIAHINEEDEDAQAVRDWAMQHDEEAEAVLEYAQREEEARQAEERAKEDPALLADLEAEGERPAASEAQELGSHTFRGRDETTPSYSLALCTMVWRACAWKGKEGTTTDRATLKLWSTKCEIHYFSSLRRKL